MSAQHPASTASVSVYEKWVNEDVAYIITDEERGAFLRLQSDADREHFIEQFWLVRDPTPNTPANEFKDEHYRRIAYANEHFASANGQTPGWRTGRGRVYITFGPPDQIDAAIFGAAASIETWHYRLIEGLGAVDIRFTSSATGEKMDVVPSAQPQATFTGASYGTPMPAGHPTVQTWSGGTAVLHIPSEYLTGDYQIVTSLKTSAGAVIQDSRSDQHLQLTRFGMGSGSYVWIVAAIEKSTGKTFAEAVQFEIKRASSPFGR
jgi:GWxTD domain-containing protein